MKQQITLIKGLKVIAFGCMLFMTVTMLHSCGGDKDTKTETAAPAADSTKKDTTAPMKDSMPAKADSGKGVTSGGSHPKL